MWLNVDKIDFPLINNLNIHTSILKSFKTDLNNASNCAFEKVRDFKYELKLFPSNYSTNFSGLFWSKQILQSHLLFLMRDFKEHMRENF